VAGKSGIAAAAAVPVPVLGPDADEEGDEQLVDASPGDQELSKLARSPRTLPSVDHGFHGITGHVGTWRAVLYVKGRKHSQGPYNTPKAAALAWDEMAKAYSPTRTDFNFNGTCFKGRRTQNGQSVEEWWEHPFHGITFHRRDEHWQAQLQVVVDKTKTSRTKGGFKTAMEAARAYDVLAKLHGHTELNFGGGE
jgi:hypothetical protein